MTCFVRLTCFSGPLCYLSMWQFLSSHPFLRAGTELIWPGAREEAPHPVVHLSGLSGPHQTLCLCCLPPAKPRSVPSEITPRWAAAVARLHGSLRWQQIALCSMPGSFPVSILVVSGSALLPACTPYTDSPNWNLSFSQERFRLQA